MLDGLLQGLMLEHLAVFLVLLLIVVRLGLARWAPGRTAWIAGVGSLLSSAVAVAVITEAVARPYYVPTGSMKPTIQEGDRVLADLLDARVNAVQRGDVVIITSPEGIRLCKRVIGLAGDRLEISGGQLMRNGVPVAEGYVKELMGQDMEPTVVPAGDLFVMGDNRNNSRDSRSYGPLPASAVKGRVTTVWWPPQHFQRLPREPQNPSSGRHSMPSSSGGAIYPANADVATMIGLAR